MLNISEEGNNNRAQDYCKMLLFLNESANDMFFFWDVEKNFVYFSRQMSAMKGREYRDKIPENIYAYDLNVIRSVIYKADLAKVEQAIRHMVKGIGERMDIDFRYVSSLGKKVWINCRGNVLNEGGSRQPLMLGCLSRRVLSEKVDMLTGLMNYNKMLENIQESIGRGHRGHMLILGIDNFREINHQMGRGYGNYILKSAAEEIEDSVQEQCSVYRMDGDHFGVDLTGCSRRETEEFFHKLQSRTESLCEFSGGAVCYPYDEKIKDMGTLVSYAENALQHSKKSGKNRLSFFSSEDYRDNTVRLEIQTELRESIRNHFEGFELYYQPQVTSNRYRLRGAEALLRFHSKKRGILSPSVFIPLLEQTEMIIPVGDWVISQAFAQCARWRRKYGDFNISVNISYVQMKDRAIVRKVLDTAEAVNLPGSAVTLELTESIQLQDYNYFNSMFYYWKEKGMQISIDDFGTGYSSLSYLKGLEVDEVKIDRCFIRQIYKSSYNYRLLRNMLELTQEAQIRVCCEGVEEAAELRCLDILSPELIQGYFFGKPMSAEDFEKTCLSTEGSYNRFVNELRQRYQEQSISAQVPESDTAEKQEYKAILDSLKTVVYVVDRHDLELKYMNLQAKKLTGVYDYFGRKCFQVFRGCAEQCESCVRSDNSEAVNAVSRMFYECYRKKMLVRVKNIQWHQSEMRLIMALPVDGMEGFLDRRLNQELYTAEKIIEMYELAQDTGDEIGIFDRLMAFTGQYYCADRVTLFLWNEALKIWEDTASYQAQGVMGKERYLEITTQESIGPWLDYIRRNKAVYIRDREFLREEDEELYREYLQYGASSSMLMGIWHDREFVGFIGVDNPETVTDSMVLLYKTAFLTEKLLFSVRDDQRSRLLLHRLLEKKLDHSILTVSGVGLWQMRIDKITEMTTILSDGNMKRILSIDEETTPAACYRIWRSRTAEDYLEYIRDARDTVMVTDKTIQIEFPYMHPERGRVILRCVGTKTSENDSTATIDGYCCTLEDMLKINKR